MGNASRRHDAALEMHIAERLRKRRLSLKMTQTEVAKRIGVTNAAICQWENEINFPYCFAQYQAWARALDLPLIIGFCDELRGGRT